jgi:hypothetical protein
MESRSVSKLDQKNRFVSDMLIGTCLTIVALSVKEIHGIVKGIRVMLKLLTSGHSK